MIRRKRGDGAAADGLGVTLREIYPPDAHADDRLEALIAKLNQVPSRTVELDDNAGVPEGE